MSQLYYTKKWEKAQSDLKIIVAIERPEKPEVFARTRQEALGKLFIRYLKYIDIYNSLLKCYDNMVHPQKRDLITKCLDGVTGRIAELRKELMRVEAGEYVKFGPLCAVFKVLPSDLDMELPKTYTYQRLKRIRETERLLDHVLNTMETAGTETETVGTPSARFKSSNLNTSSPTSSSAVSTKTTDIYAARLLADKCKRLNIKTIIKFQSVYRGYMARKELMARREAYDTFIDAREPSKMNSDKGTVDKETVVVSERMKIAEENRDQYLQDLEVNTEALKDSAEKQRMVEDMRFNIRQWLLECRAMTGEFPDFPEEEIGGSALLFEEKSPDKLLEELEDPEDEKTKAKNDKSKDKGKEKQKEKSKGKKNDIPEEFTLVPSNFIENVLVDAIVEYESTWRNRDEEYNPDQKYDHFLLQEEIRDVVDAAIRKEVDELMREELTQMLWAIDRTKIVTKKKSKQKVKKQKKPKDKKKRLKDLTPGIPLEELFAELVLKGVIRKVPKVSLKDYIGEVNFMSEDDNPKMECLPDLGDVRKMIFDFVILPMSNPAVHELVPFDKSLMIVGPKGSGKKMLVHAICTELGAYLFDLSAENISGNYLGPPGQQRLMHLVMKVGKLLEPSIIYIGNCDLMFTKKLPRDAPYSPGRMKGDLVKAMRTIGPEDRIMLIGTSRKPYMASQKPLMKMYERIVFISPPTYPSRYKLWETMIREHLAIITDHLHISTLAKLSSGFIAADIIKAVEDVMTDKRVVSQRIRPLRTSEFVSALSLTAMPLFREEIETLKAWRLTTPLAKAWLELREKEEAGVNVVGLL